MIDLVITFALLMGGMLFVLAVLGMLAELIARRESSESPTAGAHSRRGDPAARLLSMDEAQAERQRQAFTAALSRTIREIEADRRWGRVSRPIYTDNADRAIDALIEQTDLPRRSQA